MPWFIQNHEVPLGTPGQQIFPANGGSIVLHSLFRFSEPHGSTNRSKFALLLAVQRVEIGV